jgi:hypothetical protein
MIDYFYGLDYDDRSKQPSSSDEKAAGSGRKVDMFGSYSLPLPIEEDEQPTQKPETSPSPSIINARVYAIADKYGIPGLKDLSRKKFRDCLVGDWDNDSFSNVIRFVYKSTPEQDRGLRKEVVAVAKRHIHKLRDRVEFKTTQREVPDFTLDLLDSIIDDLENTDMVEGWAGWT